MMALLHATSVIDRTLLHAANAAMERGDLNRADSLFAAQFRIARADPASLAAYGTFCLRTGRHAQAIYLLDKAIRTGTPDAGAFTELGFARWEAQDVDGARRAFEAALALAPAHPLANYGLAQCARQSGDWTKAADGFRTALAAEPGNVAIVLDLAEACANAGDAAEAERHYRAASALAPAEPGVALAHGVFLRGQGEYARALEAFAAFSRAHPHEPVVLLEIARCRRAMGETARALEALAALQRAAPDTPETHEELGNVLAGSDAAASERHWSFAADRWIRARRFDLAAPVVERMVRTHPEHAAGWNLKGLCHDASGQLEQARAAFEHAVALDARAIDAAANLANLEEQSNRLGPAKAVAERALAQDVADTPGNRFARNTLRLALARVARRGKEFERAFGLLDELARDAPTDKQRRMGLVERGKAADQSGDVEAAFTAFAQANALALAEWKRSHPVNRFAGWTDQMLALERGHWQRGWRPVAERDDGPQPVFLVGFPRSGTTLMNQILDSHSAIRVLEERKTVERMLEAARAMPEGYPDALAACDDHDVAHLRAVYFAAAREYGHDDPSRVLVDKLPLNLTKASLIHRVFPRAKFVFAVRHPCDAVLSCFMQDFELNEAMANFCTLADTVAIYTRTMDLWHASREAMPLAVHAIRYEDLVDDFEGQVRALCDFVGVPWEEGQRDFSGKALERGRINTPSYEQVSQPIYRQARFRWERYRRHLAPFLPALLPWIARLGYPDPGTSAPDAAA